MTILQNEETSPERFTAVEALNALLERDPGEAVTLWYLLGQNLYDHQRPLTVDGSVLVCPQCSSRYDGREEEPLYAVAVGTNREYLTGVVPADRTVHLTGSDQDPGAGDLLYLECPHCSSTLKVPADYDEVRS